MTAVGPSAAESEVWTPMVGPAAGTHVLGAGLGGGVALGTTRAGKAATIRLLKPSPVRIVVVEQAWVASLLAIRAAALGARTFIVTQRPAPWSLLVRSVGGLEPFASVVGADAPNLPSASVAEPLCVMLDGTPQVPETGIARGPWHTSVHLMYRLSPASSSLVDTADLILVPQPPDDELESTVAMLRLPPAIGAQIARMANGEMLAVTRSRALFVTVQGTPSEIAVLGAR